MVVTTSPAQAMEVGTSSSSATPSNTASVGAPAKKTAIVVARMDCVARVISMTTIKLATTPW